MITIKYFYIRHICVKGLSYDAFFPHSPEGVNYAEIDAKDPETLTEEEKIALLGRPRLGDITKISIRIKESKEFKVRQKRPIKTPGFFLDNFPHYLPTRNWRILAFWAKFPNFFCSKFLSFLSKSLSFSQKPLSFITRVVFLAGTLSFIPVF